MGDSPERLEDGLCMRISLDGGDLTVTATEIGEDQWELSAANEHGISSGWMGCFSTAWQAIEGGNQGS